MLSVGGESLGYLKCQLTGWSQHQDLGVTSRTIQVGYLGHAGECWQCEGCGLTGTGLCQANNVTTFEQQWDGCGLNRGWLLVAKIGHSGHHAGVEAQFAEKHGRLFGCIVVGGVCRHVSRHEEVPHSFGEGLYVPKNDG